MVDATNATDSHAIRSSSVACNMAELTPATLICFHDHDNAFSCNPWLLGSRTSRHGGQDLQGSSLQSRKQDSRQSQTGPAERHLGLAARLGDAFAILGVVGPHSVHLV